MTPPVAASAVAATTQNAIQVAMMQQVLTSQGAMVARLLESLIPGVGQNVNYLV